MAKFNQSAVENVVGQIKTLHASLDEDGKKVLTAILAQAQEAGSNGTALKFAPDRTVMLRTSEPACW